MLERSSILQIYQYLSILAEAAEFSSVPLHTVCWDRSLGLKYKKKIRPHTSWEEEVMLFPLIVESFGTQCQRDGYRW